jgi:hypothetical protein
MTELLSDEHLQVAGEARLVAEWCSCACVDSHVRCALSLGRQQPALKAVYLFESVH